MTLISNIVNFETAALAKEKGFDLPVNNFYSLYHKQLRYLFKATNCNSYYKDRDVEYHSSSYSAPTKEVLLDWLSKKGIVTGNSNEDLMAALESL